MRELIMEQALYKAFVAGFKASNEGWNGEYPFSDKAMEVSTDVDIQQAFAEWSKK